MFGAGQRATAVAEDLFGFLYEVLPLMEEIDGSLRESAGRMPHATLQLQNVTEATEVATTEILDLVDGALRQLDLVGGLVDGSASADGPQVGAAAAELRALLRAHLPDPATQAEAERLLEASRREVHAEAAARCGPALRETRDHLNRILIALQVQDITAQQIAAVNHLIGSVQTKLRALIARLADEETAEATPRAVEVDPSTFDPNARYDRSGEQQSVADDVMAGRPGGDGATSGDGAASQHEIDDLFGAAQDGDGQPASEPGGEGGVASQSDIDALFGGG